MFGTFMEVLDNAVVNMSLPHIAGNLSASVDEAAWALTSYLVANAIILPMHLRRNGRGLPAGIASAVPDEKARAPQRAATMH